MHPIIDPSFLASVMDQLMAQIQDFWTWAQTDAQTLATLEAQLMPLLHTLGQTILATAAQLQAPTPPPATVPCPCGAHATRVRTRTATVITLVGRTRIPRSYYQCATCRSGQHPLDAQLHIRAGSRSAALDTVIAQVGVTQGSFVRAAAALEHLTLVRLSPSTIRAATHAVGQQVVEQRDAAAAAAQHGHDPVATEPVPDRLYLSMDGVLVNTREQGWKEVKVGCSFTTTTPRSQQALPLAEQTPRATDLRYMATLHDAHDFGWVLWTAAMQRGVATVPEVVVLGDGAHWIWNRTTALFPQATQIVDWYHARSYLLQVGAERWPDDAATRTAWVAAQTTALWAGEVATVLATLAALPAPGVAVLAALSYYTTHQARMAYAGYRAQGLVIGSGSIESGCKQVVGARLKQAGMRWSVAGAERVVAVRAAVCSGQAVAALVAQRAWQRRGYRRQAAVPTPALSVEPAPLSEQQAATAATLAAVRAELEAERQQHPWKRAWSINRQAVLAEQAHPTPPTPTA